VLVRTIKNYLAMATNLTHAQRVTRLYRRSLKHLLSWCVDREYWRQEALQLRDRFDVNRDVSIKQGTLLLEEGEREFEKNKHPNPYICKDKFSCKVF